MIYNSTDAKETHNFYKAVECDDEKTEGNTTSGYLCPDTDNIQLRGSMSEDDQEVVKEFYYVVNSCQSMNIVYMNHFGGEVWSETC